MGNTNEGETHKGGGGEQFQQDVTDPQGKVHRATFTKLKELGRGGFSYVLKMKLKVDEDECTVAVKFPFDDARDVIEKDLLVALGRHPNVTIFLYSFTRGPNNLCHLVFEFTDGGDLFGMIRRHFKVSNGLGVYTELFIYQICRALAYCHAKKIIHRDLKPENCLISESTGRLRLIDFGCACFVKSDQEDHINYVGTRDFRAPELLFGATHYSYKVDTWGIGVILTEMLLSVSIFYGAKSSKEQAVKIIDFLGPPTADDCKDMSIGMLPWPKASSKKSLAELFSAKYYKPSLLHFLQHTIVYKPSLRMTAWELCSHEYVLSTLAGKPDKRFKLPNGHRPNFLFNFSPFELRSMPSNVANKLKELM